MSKYCIGNQHLRIRAILVSILLFLPAKLFAETTQANRSATIACGVPQIINNHLYFRMQTPSSATFSLWVQDAATGDLTLLVDPDTWPNSLPLSIRQIRVSANETLLCFTVIHEFGDQRVHFFDLKKNKLFEDTLPFDLGYSLDPLPDGSRVFYRQRHFEMYSSIVMHNVGFSTQYDRVILQAIEDSEEQLANMFLSDNGWYLCASVYQNYEHTRMGIYIKNGEDNDHFGLIVSGIPATVLMPKIADRWFYLLTDWNAPNRHILTLPVKTADMLQTKEIVPEQVLPLQNFFLVGGKILCEYKEENRSRLVICEPDGTYCRDVSFPTAGKLNEISGRWTDTVMACSVSDRNGRESIFLYNFRTNQLSPWSPSYPTALDSLK